MNKEIIIIGAGGHAKVIAEILLINGNNILGFLDDKFPEATRCFNLSILGKIADCNKYCDKTFIIAIGDNYARQSIIEKYKLNFCNAIHPSAIIASDAIIGTGCAVMARAVINSGAKVGSHTIINTAAVIEHDNTIDDFVHISPGAILGGAVKIGKCSHIGLGAVIKNNVDICPNSLVGAGGVVTKNITIPGTYVGVPAKLIK